MVLRWDFWDRRGGSHAWVCADFVVVCSRHQVIVAAAVWLPAAADVVVEVLALRRWMWIVGRQRLENLSRGIQNQIVVLAYWHADDFDAFAVGAAVDVAPVAAVVVVAAGAVAFSVIVVLWKEAGL